MNKQKIIGTTLALALTASAMVPFGGVAFADAGQNAATQNNSAKAQVECSQDALDCGFLEQEVDWYKDYYNAFVKDGVLTQAEADKLIDVETKVLNLYTDYENLSDEALNQLDEKAAALYDSVSAVQDKVDQAETAAYYQNFVDNGVLTKDETEQLKAVDKKVEALMSDAKDETATEASDKLYESVKDILDKITTYEEKRDAADEDAYYQSLIKDGFITADEVKAVKEADAKVESLIENTKAETAEELEALEKQIDAVYEALVK